MVAPDLARLPNLGPKSAAMLAAAGIATAERLAALGAVRAFQRVERAGQAPSLNLLWALEGALCGRRWQTVARNARLRLLMALEDRRAAAPRRVRLIGPESTGKTTLARRLARHCGGAWVPEFVRGYLEAFGRRDCVPEDLAVIVAGQVALEDDAADATRGWLFCDTDPLTTVVYARHYLGGCSPALEAIAAARRYDVTLFTDTDLPWVPDPLRAEPERRGELRERFLAALAEFGVEHATVRGSGEARVDAALAALGRGCRPEATGP